METSKRAELKDMQMFVFILKIVKRSTSYPRSLIAITILRAAVRAFPGDPVAGHSPLILIHAFLAYRKSTPALPAEHKLPVATMTQVSFSFSVVLLSGPCFLRH